MSFCNVIIGGGSFASELYEYMCINEIKNMFNNDICVIADQLDNNLKNKKLFHYKSFDGLLNDRSDYLAIYLGSGKSDIKIKMNQEISKFLSYKYQYGDHLAVTGSTILTKSIGRGTVIAPNAVIAPFSTIGENVLVNYGATIGHGSIIDDFVSIGPNSSIGGNCHIKYGAYVGSGACIREKITIGKNAIVGMGAVVVSDVPDNTTVIGVPARKAILKGGWK